MLNVLQGHSLAILKTLPDRHFHCVITSPPYWGLRDYGIEPQIWGGNPDCAHEWETVERVGGGGQPGEKIRWNHTGKGVSGHVKVKSDFCIICNAWRGSLGAEPTPKLYVKNMVELFREVRRVLRDDGSLWLNMGDAYAASATSNHGRGKARPSANGKGHPQNAPMYENPPRFKPTGDLKPKDLIGLPWMIAFALRSDGWWLRSDLIWHKPNVMPSSVKDRPTTAHEYMFLLTKASRYFYDSDAVREKTKPDPRNKQWGKTKTTRFNDHSADLEQGLSQKKPEGFVVMSNPLGRNLRSVWKIPTRPYKGAHFATFPPALVEPCILAGTSERGCCAECGAPWERVIETKSNSLPVSKRKGRQAHNGTPPQQSGYYWKPADVINQSWRPTCKHDAPVVPCRILDPFGGSGTVGEVGLTFNRAVTLIELNPKYIELIYKRCKVTPVFPLAAVGD